MDGSQSALALYEEAMGYTYAAALRAAATMGVADHVGDGGGTVAELAAATGTDPDGLHRVLRLLAARGIVRIDGEGRVHLTAKGSALRSDAPYPARAGILMFTDRMFWTVTHEVARAVRAERPSFDEIFGMSLGEYFDRDAEATALYYEGMETVSDAEHLLLARGYDFPPTGVLVDVGGGRGGFLLTLLREYPKLEGVLVDREHVVARHRLDAEDVAGRWTVEVRDFLTGLPHGDVYVLKRILHNWDDGESVRILRNCRDAMALTPRDRSVRSRSGEDPAGGGRVLVIDAIVPPGPQSHQSHAMDFMMLAARTGRERTAADLEPLFDAAGLRLTRVVPTPSAMSIVEGVPR